MGVFIPAFTEAQWGGVEAAVTIDQERTLPFEQVWQTLGLDDETRQPEHDATIIPRQQLRDYTMIAPRHGMAHDRPRGKTAPPTRPSPQEEP